MKEFIGIGGFTRQPEGYMSWQHLTFVTSLIVVMTILAILLGIKNRNNSYNRKNRVLMLAAILMDSVEIFKIAMICLRSESLSPIRHELPLFLCSIQLITIPLAAFSKGLLKEASLDFVTIFGILGMIFGTYFAGQNYACYPVLSLDNVTSGVTHSIAGFAALYIMVSGMVSMKKKNIWITFLILISFCVAAYVVNVLIDYNYMFLVEGDGTPYDIFYRLVNGSPVLYPMIVTGLFLAYIIAFYGVFFMIAKRRRTCK